MIDELTMIKDNLRILNQQRDALLDAYTLTDIGSIKEKDISDSFCEESQVVRNLHSDKYRMEWILKHWEKIKQIIDDRGYKGQDERDFIRFFAKNFDILNEMYSTNQKYKDHPELTDFFFEQIKIHHKLTIEMINVNDRTHDRLCELCNWQKIRNIQWNKEISEAQKIYGGK